MLTYDRSVKSAVARLNDVIVQEKMQWLAWVATRLLLCILGARNSVTVNDVYYYFNGLNSDDPSALQEYPLMGLFPAAIAEVLAKDSQQTFVITFAGVCLLFDALFLLTLQSTRGRRTAAAWFWIAFAPLMAHFHIMRLDLFPALLVGWAALALYRHPKTASVLLGFATAMKLWPGVLAVGLVRHWRDSRTWRTIAAFVGTLIAICVSIAVVVGVDRILSPLNYQDVRGLQVESVVGTPLVWVAQFNPENYDIYLAESKSFEIFGPGVSTAILISDIATVLMLAFAVGWALWRFLRGGFSAQATVALWVALIFLLLCTNKVFSTQYVVWLGPIVAVALLRLPRTWELLTIGYGTLVTAALTLQVFPYHYADIIHIETQDSLLGPIFLVVRNVLVLVLTAIAVRYALKVQKLNMHEFHEPGARDHHPVALSEDQGEGAVTEADLTDANTGLPPRAHGPEASRHGKKSLASSD